MGTSTSRTRTTIASAWCFASVLAGCGAPAVVPADYERTYQEVRDCRRSGDHDLNFIRVLTDPAAFEAYQQRDRAFPLNAVVMKVEYADQDCTDVAGFTAMKKLETGAATEGGDWQWQKLDGRRRVLEDGQPPGCVGCHRPCQGGTQGHDWTCTEP
jgi:hypothetical protein